MILLWVDCIVTRAFTLSRLRLRQVSPLILMLPIQLLSRMALTASITTPWMLTKILIWIVIIMGNLWVRKGNLHAPHGKPAPLQWVVGFPLSRVWDFVEAQLRMTGLVGSYARRPVSKNCILRSCKYLPMHADQSVRTGVHWRTSYTTYTTSECA